MESTNKRARGKQHRCAMTRAMRLAGLGWRGTIADQPTAWRVIPRRAYAEDLLGADRSRGLRRAQDVWYRRNLRLPLCSRQHRSC